VHSSYAHPGDEMTCRFEAWEVALDRIELDVIRAERALARGDGTARVDAWHTPDDYGPIPTILRNRAEELLVRQRQVLRALLEQMAASAEQGSALI
jgi:hypothetical protein